MHSRVGEKINNFFLKYRHRQYKKGEILVRAGDEPSGIFYLKKGTVKEYAISGKGDELVVNIFKPISFFPVSWAINNTPNEYFFEAITHLDVWKAPREEVVEFLKGNADVLYDLISRVFKGVDGVLTRMIYLMAGHAYARLVMELVIHARRFGLSHHISEIDLASRSGMTRETVSREMRILKEKGLVEFRKNVLIVKNLRRLEDELMGD